MQTIYLSFGTGTTLEGHSTGLWPVERMSPYNSSCLYESDKMSLSDSNGTLYVWAGRNLGRVLPQFHGPSCRRGKGGHPPVFAQGISNCVGQA